MNKLGAFCACLNPGDAFDWDALCQMTDCFLAGGGRYFDTCYTYLNGNSELGVKKCVAERYPRDQFLLAGKSCPDTCAKNTRTLRISLIRSWRAAAWNISTCSCSTG